MFSILQKPHDSVTAEDLEILQNELEKHLVDIVTRSWDLEFELESLNSGSPAPTGPSGSAASLALGKLRNTIRANNSEHPENSNDAHKNGSSNTDATVPHNGANGINSADESISSEDSCTRSVDDDINSTESGSQAAQSQLAGASSKKRSLKDDRPSKRFRQNSSNSLNLGPVSFQKRPSQSKHRSKIVPSKFRNSSDESRINKKQLHKNEAPDKLWPFVEQFCVAPTDEQIRELEEMVKALDNDKDYFKIPPLGKRDGSTKDSPSKVDSIINETSNSSTAPATSSATGSKKKNAKNRKEAVEKAPDAGLGALTQRLVSSFIESPDETSTSNGPDDSSQPNSKKKANSNIAAANSGTSAKSKSTKKNIDLSKAKNLEQRIRQELEEHDILNQQDDLPYSSEDDEILRELIASQHELLSIQNQNKEFMNRLLIRARNYSELESEREKLREANADVIAAYHKLIQARQRKRNPTKKEKDVAWRALKVQEAIFDKCDELYLTGLAKQD